MYFAESLGPQHPLVFKYSVTNVLYVQFQKVCHQFQTTGLFCFHVVLTISSHTAVMPSEARSLLWFSIVLCSCMKVNRHDITNLLCRICFGRLSKEIDFPMKKIMQHACIEASGSPTLHCIHPQHYHHRPYPNHFRHSKLVWTHSNSIYFHAPNIMNSVFLTTFPVCTSHSLLSLPFSVAFSRKKMSMS